MLYPWLTATPCLRNDYLFIKCNRFEYIEHRLPMHSTAFTVFKMIIFHSTACSGLVLHFTAKFWFYILHFKKTNFLALFSILHFDGILFYILQALIFSNFTAKTLVIFHSTFSKKVSIRLYILHINPPLRWNIFHDLQWFMILVILFESHQNETWWLFMTFGDFWWPLMIIDDFSLDVSH